MTTDRLKLYHVTSVDNAFKIIETGGVDPSRSTGKRAVCWCVTKTLIPWAVAHVLNRHNLELPETCVLTLSVHPSRRIRTNKAGVWCVENLLYPIDIDLASVWLDRSEARVYIPSGHRKRGWRYGYKSL